MTKCPTCGTAMQALFTGEFCPNDCDKRKAPTTVPHVVKYDPASVRIMLDGKQINLGAPMPAEVSFKPAARCDEGGSHRFEHVGGVEVCTNGCFKSPERAAQYDADLLAYGNHVHSMFAKVFAEADAKMAQLMYEVVEADPGECVDANGYVVEDDRLTVDDLADEITAFMLGNTPATTINRYEVEQLAYKLARHLDNEGWIAEVDSDDDEDEPRYVKPLSEHVQITITEDSVPVRRFGTPMLLGAQPEIPTIETLTGSALDAISAMVTDGVCRRYDEDDAAFRARVLRDLDEQAVAARKRYANPLVDQWRTAWPEIEQLGRVEHPNARCVPYTDDGIALIEASVRDALNAHTHPTASGPTETPEPVLAVDPVCEGKLGCGRCAPCRRYMGEP